MYKRQIEIAQEFGFTEFSNYLLYNFKDTPKDLYERLLVCINLNKQWSQEFSNGKRPSIYSYPMRYAPINENNGNGANKSRDFVKESDAGDHDWLNDPVWTKRFVRNIEVMKGATHGSISPTSDLALRTIGSNFQEFLSNLYMPEELLRNRNKHERKLYRYEPRRNPGSGLIEEFRKFILKLLKKKDERFVFFHNAVCSNSLNSVRQGLDQCRDEEIENWLKQYLKK